MTFLADIQSLFKQFEGILALADFSCTVAEKEILGLLGPNGAGKTTFFNVVTGLQTPDAGWAFFKGESLIGLPIHKIASLGIARTFQNLRLIRRITVLENVLLSFKNQPGDKLFNVLFRPSLCKRHEASNREKALKLLEAAELTVKANDLTETLSYGQMKLLSLICCLATDAKLLLLDEPVAGIAPETAKRILEIIADLPKLGKSAIVIEHNIDALKDLAHRMIFMDTGRKIIEGVPDNVLDNPLVIEAYLD